LTGVIVDSAWHVVEEGIVGIAIALVYGMPQALKLDESELDEGTLG
jgi:hypothetical protein